MKKKINESTGTPGSPGTKGYTGYLPSEKYAKYRSDLARIIKKTTGYELVELEPIVDDTIDVLFCVIVLLQLGYNSHFYIRRENHKFLLQTCLFHR